MATITRRTPNQGTQTNLFRHINFSFLSITTHSYYYLSQRQSTSSSASWHFASLLPACYAELKSSSCEDHRRCQTYARHGTVVFGSLGLVYLAATLLPDLVGYLLYLLYILFLQRKQPTEEYLISIISNQ
ncbi:hypothetical protein ACSBR2_026798 [Camellia fascicularis]